MMDNILIKNIDKLHTTTLGSIRIKKNSSLDVEPVLWCKEQIMNNQSNIIRRGKNWYVTIDGYIITVNASSYTIITVHKIK